MTFIHMDIYYRVALISSGDLVAEIKAIINVPQTDVFLMDPRRLIMCAMYFIEW